MPNITSGMDIGQVRQLSKELQDDAQQIRTLTRKLTARLDSVPWVGPDYSRFKGDWHGQHVGQLNNVANALEEASRTANRNANEQQQASGN